ncbi:MAG: amidohydrolase family protein [Bacteroidota bacterium]
MKPHTCCSGCLLLAILSLPFHSAFSQTSIDRDLLAEIEKIRAIDNHAHVLPARSPDPVEGERKDPLGKAPFAYPVRLLVTNPEYVEAWHVLYGYRHDDMTADHAREALKTKLRLMQEKGTEYPAWVLDQAGIDAVLVNMPLLGPGQNAPRFLWVPRADGFLFPFPGGEERINWFRKEVGLDSQPAGVHEYLETIRRRLDQWKDAGAVAIKFATAYIRPLDFDAVSDEEANHIFERYHQDRRLSAQDTKALQDFLFRLIAREAGRRGLIVQIHTGIGAEPYFNIGGSNPMHLETMFNDTALRQTRFVMLHGGWPFDRETGAMLIKPNVYADFSAQVFLRSTEALSRTLRDWLEWYPEKVLFGTDAYPDDTPLANWEEKLWLASGTSRQALALALTRMMKDGEITRARAVELARMVLHDNAAKLYGLEMR